MKFHRGSSLVVVLMTGSLICFFLLAIWQLEWIGRSSLANDNQRLMIRLSHELEILMQEEVFMASTAFEKLSLYDWIDFVPDTLHFGEKFGVDYFLLHSNEDDEHRRLFVVQSVRLHG